MKLFPKYLLMALITLGIFTYIGLSIWFFGPGNGLSFIKSLSSSTPWTETPSGGFPLNQPPAGTAVIPSPTPTPTPAPPTPTPTPLQGPGRYACDPNGICNDTNEEARKSCPVTFADPRCLNQCGNTAKRCTQ